ncbi:acyltransferase [Cytophagaceae bacterium YF14B1]|uniref:Acyltransferase n=1 Tax=Xanthocytophaga flava TaxID=3048013 RepID=A0AAE3U8V8_9BACT|nr:acyltransferase [Xanthocytophaga flavus]MDJ1484439.1 acyltransferase [Xanthocytophaga flavus]
MKIDQLTFTRFLAAISIVIYHYGLSIFPFSQTIIKPIFESANLGVSYFFLLSGFILTIVYYDKATINIKEFWIARFARIYPVYLFSLFLILIPKVYASGMGVLLSTRMFTHTLLLQSWYPPYTMKWNYPAWSLSVEVFFYFIFPFFIFFARKWRLKKLVLSSSLLWIASMTAYYILSKKDPLSSNLFTLINFSPIFHLATFIVGITTGRIYKEIKPLTNEIIIQSILFFAILLFLICIYLKATFIPGIFIPLFSLIILTLSWSKAGLSALLSTPLFVLLGEISFSIYILQEPVRILYNLIFGEFIVSSIVHFYMYVVVLIGSSFICYRFIEIPMRNKIRQYMHRHKTPEYSISK